MSRNTFESWRGGLSAWSLLTALVVGSAGAAASQRVAPQEAEGTEARSEQDDVLEEYLARQECREAEAAEVEKAFGKPFPEFTSDDYDRFMRGLDLNGDDDLFRWSHVTNIPILAVRKRSGFFYENLHLLTDERLADQLYGTRVKTEYDPGSGVLELRSEQGRLLPVREILPGTVRPTGRSGRLWYLVEFGEDHIVPEVLGPYLVRLRDLAYRDAIGSWIRSLPLSVVQIFRGKGIYFTSRPTIPLWSVIGPFENPDGASGDQPHPPESEPVDLGSRYEGQSGQALTWREARRDPSSKAGTEFLVDLDQLLGAGRNAAAYLVVWVHAPEEMAGSFSFGSSDGAVVWINGERKFSWLEGRRDYAARANTVPIALRKGANEILVKVTVTDGGWQFAAHLTDREGKPLEGIRFDLQR